MKDPTDATPLESSLDDDEARRTKQTTPATAEPDEPVEDVEDADDTPGLTEAEFQARRAQLEARLAKLNRRVILSRKYPRWYYSATAAPVIVQSKAEAEALEGSWQVTPVEAP